MGGALACQRVPEMPEDGGGGGGGVLLAEVFHEVTADWHSFFGTLCVLLWLLYLVVL